MENTQNTLSGKMWQGLFQAIKVKTSAGSLKKSQKPTFQCLIVNGGQLPEWLEAGGAVQLGDSWTLNIGECPSVENVSTLYTVLVMNVPQKYYLSAKACLGILRRAEQRGRTLPEILETALKEQIQWQQALSTKNVSYTLTTADRHAVAVPCDTPLATEESHSYRLSGYGDYKEGIGTLRASGGDYGGGSENFTVTIKKIAEKVKYLVRRMIPIECERLDGFPDDWTRYGASGKEMADTIRYTALGNSIAVPCAERVFAGIVAAEEMEI